MENLCADKHPEIWHRGKKCPFCEYIEDKEDELNDLASKIDELECIVEKEE